MSNKFEQLGFKLEKILGLGNMQEKLENILTLLINTLVPEKFHFFLNCCL